MINFHQRFIPDAAQLMLPLFEAFSTKAKTLVWNDAKVDVFQATTAVLASAASTSSTPASSADGRSADNG